MYGLVIQIIGFGIDVLQGTLVSALLFLNSGNISYSHIMQLTVDLDVFEVSGHVIIR